MNNLLTGLQTWTSTTANGAVTNPTSLNECLDLFFLSGASRTMSKQEIVSMFSKAFNQDKSTALKILFWARDIRGGAWERRLFRIILSYLCHDHPDIYADILEYIAVYWRWDDLFFNEDITNHSMDYLKEVISKLEDKLLFKWLPREKSTNKKIAQFIRGRLEMTPKAYRQMLSENSITIENQLCDNEWDEVEYKKVPSKAFNLYSAAFMKHDEERFTKFIEKVEEWETTINAGAIFPVDIYKSFTAGKATWPINAQWSALPDYMNDENILAVCDTSASMNWEPMDVSVSLGVYISERSKWIFKDHFITFEGQPKLQKVSGSPTDRFRQIQRTNSDCSTNIQWVFELLLKVAERDWLKQEDMPTKILIISDMEFNEASDPHRGGQPKTNFQAINEMYNESKYTRPQLVFWNVHWRLNNVPVQTEDNNTALVSGYSPSILTSILWGEDFTPMGVMLKTISKYTFIDKLYE